MNVEYTYHNLPETVDVTKEMEELKRLMKREKELIEIISNSVTEKDMSSCFPDYD